MAQVSFITPLDQPSGSKRLLDILRTGLKDPRFTQLRIVTAYAKSGPLLRLKSDIES
ncbi:restriction endonuclease, partial [Salmonella enterica subsp. enterica]|nr:restriction endonuclease [Salmonella enterica subsp. enterica]